MTWPIPIETCQTYRAHNPKDNDFSCPKEKYCSTFRENNERVEFEKFPTVTVTELKRIRGVNEIKKALENGPLNCSMMVTHNFVLWGYNKDQSKIEVYSERLDFIEPNHLIAIVGWAKHDDGSEYWIGRNSWGRYWGYDGIFYIKLGENQLGLESDCLAVEGNLHY